MAYIMRSCYELDMKSAGYQSQLEEPNLKN